MADNRLTKEEQSLIDQDISNAIQEESILSAEEQTAIDQEINLEKKYGDQTAKAGALGAARGLSFGLSDVALKKLGFTEEELREIDERNRAASITGEIAGVAGPALLSGGTSAVARGAQVAGKGIAAATKAGAAAERITASALQNAIKKSGKETLARRIVKDSIPKSAGFATEGAFYGAGELLSENALGRADLNAENLASTAGVSALIGGAAGPIFSTAQAIVPIVKGNKIVDYAVKKLKPNVDVSDAAAGLSGYTNAGKQRLKEMRPDIYENLAPFYKNRLDLKAMDSIENLSKKASKSIDDVGSEIDSVLTKIDDIADDTILPSKDELRVGIQSKLDDLAKEFEGIPSDIAKKNLRKIEKERKALADWEGDLSKATAKDLRELKTKYQKLGKYEKKFQEVPLEVEIIRQAGEGLREQLLKVADNVSTINNDLGSQLRKANLDYGTAIEISKTLGKKADKIADKSFASFRDILFADLATDLGGAGIAGVGIAAKKFLESDFRRKLQVLKSIEKANKKVEKTIKTSVKNFLEKPRQAIRPTTIKTLTESMFSLPEDKRKATNKKEAVKIIRENLSEYQSDPEKLTERIIKNSSRMTKVAPETASNLNNIIVNAVGFLAEKMPKDFANNDLYSKLGKREFEPSDLEVSQFERYIQAIENPMSILEDLQSGTLTREKVEAVQVVYPNLYQNIREEVMDQIASDPKSLSYQKKIQAGILLDLPTDSSLESQNIIALQEIHNPPEEQQQQSGQTDSEINPTMTGLKNIDKSDRVKTPMQDALSDE